MDLHPDFGDAALYLGLTRYRYHFFELIENTEKQEELNEAWEDATADVAALNPAAEPALEA